MSYQIDTNGAKEYLTANGWPSGMQESAILNMANFPIRFMIIDDSGSMGASDGHRVVKSGANVNLLPCTRWKELVDIVKFQAGLAKAANAVTEFRLLNNAAPIVVGAPGDQASFQRICQIMDTTGPSGGTPLCRHVNEVVNQIRSMETSLRANGHKAAVIICTDGEASDGDISQALKPLHELPVWVVLRLCTDEQKVVNYWNNIDKQLELNVEILDDLVSEAKEVYAYNKWFTYGQPLHLLRQFGVSMKELDMMDEASLTVDQVRDVCAVIFGGSVDEYPHPTVDPKGFMRVVAAKNKKEPKVWNPVTKRLCTWVDPSKIKGVVGGKCIVS